jgi:hypothetical protein
MDYVDQGRGYRAARKTLADNPYHRLMSPMASHEWCRGWSEEDERQADEQARLDALLAD